MFSFFTVFDIESSSSYLLIDIINKTEKLPAISLTLPGSLCSLNPKSMNQNEPF